MVDERDYRIQDHPGKDPDESLPVIIDLFNLCANFWQANEPYTVGEFVRPLRATGFAYECVTAGTSGAREPVWPQTIGQTIIDGSVAWTCNVADMNGINEITSPSAQPDPPGLTVSDVSVVEGYKILATYAGGQEGEEYDVVYRFTLNGFTRIARQRVPVRKR